MPIYQEEKGSFLSHNNKNYDINKIFKIVHKKPIKRIHIIDLIWVLKESPSLEKNRVARANYDIPIIITKFRNKYLVVDGIHRLQKLVNDWEKRKKFATQHNKKYLPLSKITIFGKYITNKELEKTEIKQRKNPTDQNLISQLQIKKSPSDTKYDPDLILYKVVLNFQIIAKAYYDPINKYVTSVEIYDKEHKRRGIGTFLYDYIERDQNIILKPSEDLFTEGELFWAARQKRKT